MYISRVNVRERKGARFGLMEAGRGVGRNKGVEGRG